MTNQDKLVGTLNRLTKFTCDYNDSVREYNEFGLKYWNKPYYNVENKAEIFDRYVRRFYERPVDKFESFLDKSGLEDKIIESAAKGDDNNTVHWLRTYKDIVKMHYDIPNIVYNHIKIMYLNIKEEAEEILGEELQL